MQLGIVNHSGSFTYPQKRGLLPFWPSRNLHNFLYNKKEGGHMDAKFKTDFLYGQCSRAFDFFGAHFGRGMDEDGRETDGVWFRLYCPCGQDVSVIGDFNGWDVRKNKMALIDSSGIYETFIPHLLPYQSYKFHFKNALGTYVDKADPYAFLSEKRPASCSRLFDIENFPWDDEEWMKKRNRNFDNATSIYEMHLGSWKRVSGEEFPSYEQTADSLIPYLQEMGYTHVEIMPIAQHPFDGSWGYQATGFFSADSRYGNPKQLMSFVNRLHKAGIGVILDFAPVHFAVDEFGLRHFDGTHLYEYGNEHEISPWGSAQFDLGKDPVRSFLISAMNFFLVYYHFDGIRVDAVSNLLYWEGNKNNGQNIGAVEFIRRLNGKIHYEHPSVMMIAEDSTDFSGVTKPLEYGGLGFDYKWDLGWMNDTLKYYSLDPIFKKFNHHLLTFSMAYFFSENFLLPLSHDEVVHGKGTLLNKMWGCEEDRFALLRNLFVYQYGHPGKKMNFMGNELASFDEWNEKKELPWSLLTYPRHDSVKRLIRDLNLLYVYEPCLHQEEYNPSHFQWLMVDNSNQSVFAFERTLGKDSFIFLFNMTSNYYENYTIGTMNKGQYTEVFNSDKDVYGGKNQYNGLPLISEMGTGPENRPCHMVVQKISGFAAMIFKKVGKYPPHRKKKRSEPNTKKTFKH